MRRRCRAISMQKAYSSGDPYLEFAKQAGAAPADATKESHGSVREHFKACVLAVQYGMGAEALAERVSASLRSCPGAVEAPPGNLRPLLALVGCGARPRHAHGRTPTVFGWPVQSAGPQSTLVAELPDAGQWR